MNDNIKQQAMKELARRELAKRESSRTPTAVSEPESVATMGVDYVRQHPFKSLFQGLPQTLTGKTVEDRAVENINSPDFMQVESAPYDRQIPRAGNAAFNRVVGGQMADMATAPANALAAPVLKGVGMAGGAIKSAVQGTPIGKLISDMGKYSKPQAQAEFADEVQNALLSRKRSVIDNFGKDYEGIIGKSDKSVSLDAPFRNFVDNAQSLMQNPEFSQQVAAKNPQANRIFDLVNKFSKRDYSTEVSAKEADNIVKFINNLPSIRTKLNQGRKNGWHTVQWTNEDRMLIELADDIKSTVVDIHPELGALNKSYGSFMSKYKSVAPEFRIGSTVEKMKKYSQLDPQKKVMFEEIMPRGTVNKIKEFERAQATSQLLKKIGLTGAGAFGLGTMGKLGMDAAGIATQE